MVNFINISGMVVGTLTVMERVSSNAKDLRWRCECSCGCGNKNIIRKGVMLRRGLATCRTVKEKVHKNCPVCNKIMIVKQSEINKGHGKYCSKDCAATGLVKDPEKPRKSRTRKKRNPKKDNANYLVLREIRKGNIKKLACETCGDTNVHAHHCDYNKPLEIIWLCPKHHAEWHKNNKAIE